MSAVIVMNEDRIAIRIIPASVAPIERTAANDQRQQRREHSAHGSSLTCAEPHGPDCSQRGATVSNEIDRIPCAVDAR